MSNEDQQRKGIFALQVLHEIARKDVATELGAKCALLILAVVEVQDRLWSPDAPVTIRNSELARAIGVSRWESLDGTRQKAIDAGWITYHPIHKSSGYYAAQVPSADTRKAYIKADIKAHIKPSTKLDNLQSYDLNPIPLSSPEGAEVKEPEAKEQQPPKKEPRKPRPPPAAEDMELAEFIWQAIHAMQPNRKPPNLALWANDIRLMREADKRTPDEIRQVFLWANADNFWQTNILCPEKLRSKFDDLTLRMQKARKGPQQAATTQQPQAMPIDPNSKYDV